MKLIVGLGNPGKKYENTRHNMGFDVVRLFGDMSMIDIDKDAFHGLVGRGKIFDEDVLLFLPTTFMNLSGSAVQEISSYFKIKPDDMIIVYDDMAIPVGKIRLRLSGSSGGQKGMQNIIDILKTDKIKRIRVGIGEPKFNSVDYVLGRPSGEELVLLEDAKKRACEALRDIFKTNFEKAMSKYN